MNCAQCGKTLERDETGLSYKLIGRGTQTLYCLACMSQHFRISTAQLREMAEHFRQSGCTLFT